MKQRLIFLLGGYDLEMLEIKKILASNRDIRLFDGQLEWHNAKLSAYRTVIEKYGSDRKTLIYGIELQESDDCIPPANYHRIDHHNAYSANVSALEQVADLLHIELTREQQLIAANDRGYIPEMQWQGASSEEIRQIRLRDRKMQGVTDEDERLAEKAIANRTMEQSVIVVKSESNRFSPVCDQLFPYEKLLIYTNDELMYYGKGKERLVEQYDAEIKAGKMFHGGGQDGFIGTARGVYPPEDILNMKESIIILINK